MTVGRDRERQRREAIGYLVGALDRLHAAVGPLVRIDHLHRRIAEHLHVEPAVAVEGQVLHRAQPVERAQPAAGAGDHVDAAVVVVADEDAPARVGGHRHRVPRLRQLRLGRRAPQRPQHQPAQHEHLDAVVAGVAHEQVAAGGDHPRRAGQLPRLRTRARDAREAHEGAGAGVESQQARGGAIEQQHGDARAVGSERRPGRERQPAERTMGVRQRPRRAGRRFEGQRLACQAIGRRHLDAHRRAHDAPPRARVEHERIRVVRRRRDRRQQRGGRAHGRCLIC